MQGNLSASAAVRKTPALAAGPQDGNEHSQNLSGHSNHLPAIAPDAHAITAEAEEASHEAHSRQNKQPYEQSIVPGAHAIAHDTEDVDATGEMAIVPNVQAAAFAAAVSAPGAPAGQQAHMAAVFQGAM